MDFPAGLVAPMSFVSEYDFSRAEGAANKNGALAPEALLA
jgi:hypothetical protein